MTFIVGAGLAGLIAGHIFPNATILERAAGPDRTERHNALLRFRSDAVSLITGIPFRKVRVHKSIWTHEDGFLNECNPALANMYARKVTGGVFARSIWNLDSVERFVAPGSFYEQLVEQCKDRIRWGFDAIEELPFGAEDIISTMPLFNAAQAWLDNNVSWFDFKRAPIYVQRIIVADSDVHQTVYFPDRTTSTYRISITGNVMIIESMNEPDAMRPVDALAVFGLDMVGFSAAQAVKQSFGKIAPIDNAVRKELIHRLTLESRVYSLGRFATWRNILLDDVVKDARIIKAMIEQQDAYDKRMQMAST